MIEKNTEPSGEIVIKDRKSITVSGVVDVLSFDENLLSLSTALGLLVIEGEGFHVKKMDILSGACLLEGTVHACYYRDDRATHKKGLFGKKK